MIADTRVVIIGLGYVGLPLAVALARSFETWGVDVDRDRVGQLARGYDRTGEIDTDRLRASSLHLTTNPATCPDADFYIVTVPTPVDADNRPDLSILMAATRTVGGMLKAPQRSIIVYESTVYPGVTEIYAAPNWSESAALSVAKTFSSPTRRNGLIPVIGSILLIGLRKSFPVRRHACWMRWLTSTNR